MSKYYFEQQKVRVEIDNVFKQANKFGDRLKPKDLLVYDLKLVYAVADKTIREALVAAESKYPSVDYHTEDSWKNYCEVMGDE